LFAPILLVPPAAQQLSLSELKQLMQLHGAGTYKEQYDRQMTQMKVEVSLLATYICWGIIAFCAGRFLIVGAFMCLAAGIAALNFIIS
jgi:hypothetical protein